MKKRKSADNALKQFMGRPDIFADLFNAYLYDGKQVIDPKRLTPADRLLDTQIGNAKSHTDLTRFRDVYKSYHDQDMTYIMLGIENQMDVHYAMPLRNMIYDALSMLAHKQQKSARHVAMKDLKEPAEYLSRFAKTDHIPGVITLVVYVGSEPWDGPMTLHEMLELPDENLKQFIPDYFINLIVPAKMGDAMLAKFKTELSEFFGYIRFAHDKEVLYAFVMKHPRFKSLSYEAVMAINACTNANIDIPSKKENINMCQALIDMKKDAYKEGQDSGYASSTRDTVLRMQKMRRFTISDISEVTGLPTDKVEAILRDAEQQAQKDEA